MIRKLFAFFLIIGLFLTLSACSEPVKKKSGGKVGVVVTFNALAEFARTVGGDRISLTTIIPDGVEPHDFEPKVKDMKLISDADVFAYNGLGMETWAVDAVRAAGSSKLVVAEASRGSKPIAASESEAGTGEYDPHLWLSVKGAEIEAGNIKNALCRADPAGKEYYERNYRSFYDRLESVYRRYQGKFNSEKNKNFVTGHAAFAYFCRDFSLKQSSVEDVFADGEPSAKNLTLLIDFCRQNHVRTIFAEEMASPQVSKTLASSVGAKVETIYTMESAEDHLSYLSRMESNLEKIYKSLL